MRKWFIGILWGLIGIGIITFVVMFWAISKGKIGYMPDIKDLQNPINRYASQVYSADGKLMGTYSLSRENRVMVDISDISPSIVQALIATEDARFYEHSGVDFKAVGRAIFKTILLQQKSSGGGSTITQQLAKLLYSETAGSKLERFTQKPIEWAIAVELERNYTKEEIIAMYLNKFDFLNNAVGIKTAANVYFSKDPKDLTVNESAMLIGMCKNPAYYNPVRYPDRCKDRRNVVLEQMRKANYLTQEQVDSCSEQPLGLNFHTADHNDGMATYFRDFLRRYMMATKPVIEDYPYDKKQYYLDSIAWADDPLYGWCNKNYKTLENGHKRPYNIYTDGLKIYTTIDSRMQAYAEDACYKHVVEELQPVFNKEVRQSANMPYSSRISKADAQAKLKKAVKKTDRYDVMKANGASEQEIEKAFNTKTAMKLFTYRGMKDTIMTPLDSLKYMKSLLRTGFMCMDPDSGLVKAYVGGLDFEHFAYDMVNKGRRQVGSTMKPFLYSLAVSPSGGNMTPCTLVPNVDSTYHDEIGRPWHPHNGSRAREGEMVELRWGLQQSNNWVAAYLISVLKPKNLKTMLYKFGIRNPEIQATLSLCLGPCDVTVAEMVSAYTTFVNHGERTAPVYVTKITDSEGRVIATFKAQREEVINEESAHKMLTMLRAVVDGGTGSRLRNRYGIKAELGGKTGTTNENKDGWFMGVAPKLVAGCWVGGEETDIHFNTTANGQGANAALPVFAYFMKSVYADKSLPYREDDKFDLPAGFNPCAHEGDDFEMIEVDDDGNPIEVDDDFMPRRPANDDDFVVVE